MHSVFCFIGLLEKSQVAVAIFVDKSLTQTFSLVLVKGISGVRDALLG